MQQVGPGTVRDPLAGACVGIVASPGPEIEAIDLALRRAGAEVHLLRGGYDGWQGERRWDAILIRTADPDDPAATGVAAKRQLADLEAVAATHRVIALADVSPQVLTSGVRDFVSSPFRPDEVVARVARVLREPAPEEVLRTGNLELQLGNRVVLIGGQPIEVTFGEFELLRTLLAAHGSPVSRNGLLGHATPSGRAAARWVDMHIHRLRAKLVGLQGVRIGTVRGVGYRLGPS